MAAAAKKFEQEKRILDEVQHVFGHDDLYILPKTMSSADKHGYFPYCDINSRQVCDSNCAL